MFSLDGSSLGKEILAPGTGKVAVTASGEFACLTLDNKEGLIKSINIGHLKSSTLKTGDSVTAGQAIGVLGQPSGNWGGAHIHISLWSGSACGSGMNLPFDNAFVGYDLSSKTDTNGVLLTHQHYGTNLLGSKAIYSSIISLILRW